MTQDRSVTAFPLCWPEGWRTTAPHRRDRGYRFSVYLSVDKDGNEGVCAARIGPGGSWLPLVAADEARLKSITPVAEQVARESGMTIVLVEFTGRFDHRTIEGKSNG